ncbi:MAG: hypothetical protein JRI84_15530 [Deltaproteobacteria bacterium]|nr:hypothetical protein [Deltaproteobacteria bacterium]
MKDKKVKTQPINKTQLRREPVTRRKLGEILVETGLISSEKLAEGLEAQSRRALSRLRSWQRVSRRRKVRASDWARY